MPITSESVSRPGICVVADLVAHRDERAVGERHAHALALPAVGEPAEAVVAAPPAAVQARRRDAVAAVDAGVVAHVERGDHEVARLDDLHVVADRLDDADELVADAVRRRAVGVTPRYGHRSEPHTQAATTRTMASGRRRAGSGTASTRMSPGAVDQRGEHVRLLVTRGERTDRPVADPNPLPHPDLAPRSDLSGPMTPPTPDLGAPGEWPVRDPTVLCAAQRPRRRWST